MTSMLRSGKSLFNSHSAVFSARFFNNKSALISKIHREKYLRLYPTLLVQPDGSTYTIRYHEPRRIIKLPINLSEVSEEEKAIILEKRKPKKKVIIEEELDDSFDSKQYLKFFKKRN